MTDSVTHNTAPRPLLVAGNWKMHGSRAMVEQLLNDILTGLPASPAFQVAVFPPCVYLPQVARTVAGTPIRFGGQNLNEHDAGAYTGEVSGAMLADFGSDMVLVGHSERRSLYGETDQQVADKFAAALRHGLTPVLCVGETGQEREAGQTQEVVARQINAVLDTVGIEGLGQGIIAYEPVWAIGTGQTASKEQAQAVHAFIRSLLAAKSDTIARLLPILYGGSVKGGNAHELFSMPDIDGGLIGGASLTGQDFLAICEQAQKVATGA